MLHQCEGYISRIIIIIMGTPFYFYMKNCLFVSAKAKEFESLEFFLHDSHLTPVPGVASILK